LCRLEVDGLRVTLLHNPTAGDEEHSGGRLAAVIAAAGHDVVERSMKADWEAALRKPAELVVAAGGDGTVRKVFRALAGSSVVATLLPIGSANNIARSLGFEKDDDPAQLVARWPRWERRRFDIGAFGEAHFVESAGGGIFADVLARAEETDDDPGGEEKVELGLRLLRAAVEEAPALGWRVVVDGEDRSGELLALNAMNVQEAGPNMPLAPTADPGDGLLDIVFVRPEHLAPLADYAERRLAGEDPEPPALEVRRGHRLELVPPSGARLHVDDDLVEFSTAEMYLASSLTVLAPPAKARSA
jgi:diacylglycerol kinase (ATP)